MESEKTNQARMSTESWEFDGALIVNRLLEWVGVTEQGNMLMRFTGEGPGRPPIPPDLASQPVWVGFRTALRVVGDMAVPAVRVSLFPHGVSEAELATTRALLPHEDAPPVLAQAIGMRVMAVQRNSAGGLRVPPNPVAPGWYIVLSEAELYMEVSTSGLALHAPSGVQGPVILH